MSPWGGTYIGWGYLPWPGGLPTLVGDTYLGWGGYLPWPGGTLPWLEVPTLAGGGGGNTYLGWGYLPWPGGTYLDQGVPTLARAYLLWLGVPTLAEWVPTLAQGGYLDRDGVPPPGVNRLKT